jgi:Cu-Zn family superoxide dismutase
MKRGSMWICGVAAAAMAGCATGGRDDRPRDDEGPAGAAVLRAEALDPAGRLLARASAEDAGGAVRVRVEAEGLAPGAYGAHIHTTGRCEAPAFASAGPHWNPTAQQHGKDNPAGMHKGDLPNLLVGTDRRGSFEYTIPGAAAAGRGDNAILDADGAAIVIHARPDDFRTDPSGNSGDRIACGVLR